MTARAEQLHAIADRQLEELSELLSSSEEAALRLPCPGREKLGDGTAGALARHTADNYERIAMFVQPSDRTSGMHEPGQHGSHRIPRFLRRVSPGRAQHSDHGPGAAQHIELYSADNIDRDILVEQLASSRDTLARLAELTDSQLDAIPRKDSFRFCDGQRTLEQVLASLLKHQGHQVDTLRAVLA